MVLYEINTIVSRSGYLGFENRVNLYYAFEKREIRANYTRGINHINKTLCLSSHVMDSILYILSMLREKRLSKILRSFRIKNQSLQEFWSEKLFRKNVFRLLTKGLERIKVLTIFWDKKWRKTFFRWIRNLSRDNFFGKFIWKHVFTEKWKYSDIQMMLESYFQHLQCLEKNLELKNKFTFCH